MPTCCRPARASLDRLGITGVEAVVGGCFGGQQALLWSILYPEMVRRAVVIGTTAATSAHSIALFSAMRSLIRSDPDWAGGSYYGRTFPKTGTSNAMAAAVPLWLSRESLATRFGRRLVNGAEYGYTLDAEFEVEAYLDEVAGRSWGSVDPNSLLYLTRAMEYFDLEHAYGSLENAFRHSRARYLFVSYRSDWRYPPAEVDRMRIALESLGADARHVVLESPLGHRLPLRRARLRHCRPVVPGRAALPARGDGCHDTRTWRPAAESPGPGT